MGFLAFISQCFFWLSIISHAAVYFYCVTSVHLNIISLLLRFIFMIVYNVGFNYLRLCVKAFDEKHRLFTPPSIPITTADLTESVSTDDVEEFIEQPLTTAPEYLLALVPVYDIKVTHHRLPNSMLLRNVYVPLETLDVRKVFAAIIYTEKGTNLYGQTFIESTKENSSDDDSRIGVKEPVKTYADIVLKPGPIALSLAVTGLMYWAWKKL